MVYSYNNQCYGHHSGFTSSNGRLFETLATTTSYLLHEAERWFGPRDPRFSFVGIEYGDPGAGTPGLIFSGYNSSHVIIMLSDGARLNLFTAIGELAHEVVHLICPVVGSTSVLEEGMATFFAETVCPTLGTQPPTLGPRYQNARDQYAALHAIDQYAVRLLRPAIRDFASIAASDIMSAVAACPANLAAELTKPF